MSRNMKMIFAQLSKLSSSARKHQSCKLTDNEKTNKICFFSRVLKLRNVNRKLALVSTQIARRDRP